MRELGLAPVRFLIQAWATPPNKVPLEVLHDHGNESPENFFYSSKHSIKANRLTSSKPPHDSANQKRGLLSYAYHIHDHQMDKHEFHFP